MFLSPRTPKPQFQNPDGPKGGGGGATCSRIHMSSGMTPRGLNPGLTPTNFAMDFGRGINKKEDGNGTLCLRVIVIIKWDISVHYVILHKIILQLRSICVVTFPRRTRTLLPHGGIPFANQHPPRDVWLFWQCSCSCFCWPDQVGGWGRYWNQHSQVPRE